MHPYTKLLSHVLNVEFPELADTFAKMAQENGHFAKLMAQYSALDQQITDDEENVKILVDWINNGKGPFSDSYVDIWYNRYKQLSQK